MIRNRALILIVIIEIYLFLPFDGLFIMNQFANFYGFVFPDSWGECTCVARMGEAPLCKNNEATSRQEQKAPACKGGGGKAHRCKARVAHAHTLTYTRNRKRKDALNIVTLLFT